MSTVLEQEIAKIPARKRRGISWLNKNYPDWKTKVKKNLLNMQRPRDCMVGQLCGNYWDVFPSNKYQYAVSLGLNCPKVLKSSSDFRAYHDELEAAWKPELAA